MHNLFLLFSLFLMWSLLVTVFLLFAEYDKRVFELSETRSSSTCRFWQSLRGESVLCSLSVQQQFDIPVSQRRKLLCWVSDDGKMFIPGRVSGSIGASEVPWFLRGCSGGQCCPGFVGSNNPVLHCLSKLQISMLARSDSGSRCVPRAIIASGLSWTHHQRGAYCDFVELVPTELSISECAINCNAKHNFEASEYNPSKEDLVVSTSCGNLSFRSDGDQPSPPRDGDMFMNTCHMKFVAGQKRLGFALRGAAFSSHRCRWNLSPSGPTTDKKSIVASLNSRLHRRLQCQGLYVDTVGGADYELTVQDLVVST